MIHLLNNLITNIKPTNRCLCHLEPTTPPRRGRHPELDSGSQPSNSGSSNSGSHLKNTGRYLSAFTLIELLIYLGLYTILITVIMSIFATILEARTETTQVSSVNQEGKRVIARLMHDVHQATAVTLPATEGANGTSLQLQHNADALIYSVSPQNELVLTKNGQTFPLTSETVVTSFVVNRLGNSGGKPAIQVNLTLDTKSRLSNQPEQHSYEIILATR